MQREEKGYGIKSREPSTSRRSPTVRFSQSVSFSRSVYYLKNLHENNSAGPTNYLLECQFFTALLIIIGVPIHYYFDGSTKIISRSVNF